MISVKGLRWLSRLVFTGSLIALFNFSQGFQELGRDFLREKAGWQTDVTPERLLPIVDFRAGDESNIVYLFKSNGLPDGLWDPCRQIKLQINPKYEPLGFREIFEQEVAWVSSRTGLSLLVAGETLESPVGDRLPSEDGAWKDVLVAFLPEKEFLSLANEIGYVGRTVGLGGPDVFPSTDNTGPLVATTGILYFNSTWIEDDLQSGNLNEGFGLNVPGVVRHELGHLLGLDHFNSGLMAEEGDSYSVGVDELLALSMLGKSECLTESNYPKPSQFSFEEAPGDTSSQGKQTIEYLYDSASRSMYILETEAVTEFSGNWITIFAPGFTEHYSAAQFTGPNDNGSLIMEVASNIYWVWQMLQEPNVRITPTSEGFYVYHPKVTEIFVEFESGLISRTTITDSGSETTHVYEAQEPYLSKLLRLEAEVVSQW